MNGIILDTNAFRYLMNIEMGEKNKIFLEKKPVDDNLFYNYCRNANHLFVTGQTLYELLWQSIEKTGGIEYFAVLYDAIAKYRRIYNVKFSVLNDVDGIFDLKLFEKQYEAKLVDIDYFINEKRKYEAKKIEDLLYKLYISAMGVIVEHYNVDHGDEYYRWVKGVLKEKLESISKAYYENPGTKNELYDKAIERLLGTLWKTSVDLIDQNRKEYGINVPIVHYSNSGTDYMHRLFCKLKRENNKIFKEYDNFLDELAKKFKEKGQPDECIKYWRRLCWRSVHDGAKIRKNDGLDYSIITCLAKDNVINQTKNKIDLNNIFLVTFDSNLYNFSKENSILYKEEIYNKLLGI